ncbi:MAG: FliM/FliN family flagellar motor switch protein [Acidobacteriota bacterium]
MATQPCANMREFRNLQEECARRLGTGLSAYLRKPTSVMLQNVRHITWAEYCAQAKTPTCLLVTSLSPHPGIGTVELAPSLVFSALAGLLGDNEETPSAASRELTAIERRLLDRLFHLVLKYLRETWPEDGPSFALESVLSEISTVGIVGQEGIALVEFAVNGEGLSGFICLTVPARFARPRRQEFGADEVSGPVLRKMGDGKQILRRVQTGKVRVETVLTGTTIKISDLADLEPGDVLGLSQTVTTPLSLHINGAEAYTGFIVPAGQRRAFAIQALGKREHEAGRLTS